MYVFNDGRGRVFVSTREPARGATATYLIEHGENLFQPTRPYGARLSIHA